MTTEEKAKAYDEAIKRAREWEGSKVCIEYLFPGFAESEDERIREALITFFQRFPYGDIERAGTNPKEAIAWLEKQGELQEGCVRKTVAEVKEELYSGQVWSEEDEEKLGIAIKYLQREGQWDSATWLKSLKERRIWKPKKEHVKAVRLARSFVTDDFGEHPMLSEILIDLEEQLKKLREE